VKENPDGTYSVSPGEKITTTVTRTKPPCMAIFSKLNGAIWDPEVDPNPQTRVRTFKSPQNVGAQCDFTLLVDFVGNGTDTDQYIVVVKGETGDPSADTVDYSDLPVSLPYSFTVTRP